MKNTIKKIIPEYIKYLLKSKILKNQLDNITEDNAFSFTDKLKYRIKQSRNPEIAKKMALYADKYAVRKYVSDRIGKKYLINQLCITKELSYSIWNSLPQQFVIKTNFGTGAKHSHIVLNKNQENFVKIKDKFILAMKDDWYLMGQEMFYAYMDRYIIIEEYLPGLSGFKSPDDYKIHCFKNLNGEIECVIQIDRGRFESIQRNFYDDNFNLLNINYANAENFELKSLPNELIEMVILSKQLMGELTYARIDWYLVSGNIVFGEITHAHTAGTAIFTPPEANLLLGGKIKTNNIFI